MTTETFTYSFHTPTGEFSFSADSELPLGVLQVDLEEAVRRKDAMVIEDPQGKRIVTIPPTLLGNSIIVIEENETNHE